MPLGSSEPWSFYSFCSRLSSRSEDESQEGGGEHQS